MIHTDGKPTVASAVRELRAGDKVRAKADAPWRDKFPGTYTVTRIYETGPWPVECDFNGHRGLCTFEEIELAKDKPSRDITTVAAGAIITLKGVLEGVSEEDFVFLADVLIDVVADTAARRGINPPDC